MSALPASRRVINGRTYSSTWSPSYGAAIEGPPAKRRIADIAFGVCMAAIVAAFLWLALTHRLPGAGS